jgi:Asp-tRNA(Asn)/Glu-tRNA(Gln) amidotransferase C subunit
LQLEEEVSKLRGQIVNLPAHSEADLNRIREKKQEVKTEKQKLLELKKEKNRQKVLYENVVQWQEKCATKLKDIGDLCERLK